MVVLPHLVLAFALVAALLERPASAVGPTLYQHIPSGVGQYEHEVPGAPPMTSSQFSFDPNHFLCAVAGGGKNGPFNMLIYSTSIDSPGPVITALPDGGREVVMFGIARSISTTPAWPGLNVGAVRQLLKSPTNIRIPPPTLIDPARVSVAPGMAEDLACTFEMHAVDNSGTKPRKPDHFSVIIGGSEIFRDEPGRKDGRWEFGGTVYMGHVWAACPSSPDLESPCFP